MDHVPKNHLLLQQAFTDFVNAKWNGVEYVPVQLEQSRLTDGFPDEYLRRWDNAMVKIEQIDEAEFINFFSSGDLQALYCLPGSETLFVVPSTNWWGQPNVEEILHRSTARALANEPWQHLNDRSLFVDAGAFYAWLEKYLNATREEPRAPTKPHRLVRSMLIDLTTAGKLSFEAASDLAFSMGIPRGLADATSLRDWPAESLHPQPKDARSDGMSTIGARDPATTQTHVAVEEPRQVTERRVSVPVTAGRRGRKPGDGAIDDDAHVNAILVAERDGHGPRWGLVQSKAAELAAVDGGSEARLNAHSVRLWRKVKDLPALPPV